jgi:hypothetical protein
MTNADRIRDAVTVAAIVTACGPVWLSVRVPILHGGLNLMQKLTSGTIASVCATSHRLPPRSSAAPWRQLGRLRIQRRQRSRKRYTTGVV